MGLFGNLSLVQALKGWVSPVSSGEDCLMPALTERLGYPYISSYLILAARRKILDIITFSLLFGMLSPWKCKLEHAGGADETIATSSLYHGNCQFQWLKRSSRSVRTIRK